VSAARLYAVQLGAALVTVRAEVFIPSLSEQNDGDVPMVEIAAVNGVASHRLRFVTDAEWEELDRAVLAAERERRAAEREERAG
jgi:hypothetical protein